MSPDLALFAVAVALAGLAVAASRTRPPAFDPERLFKTAQAVLLRGEVERAGGRAEDWEKGVLASVLYHPAGREGWAKLEHPASWTPPVPALPGERVLLEDLARLAPGPERFSRLFGGDDPSRHALLEDPAALGPAFDPSRWLGPGCDWDAVAGWTEAVEAVLTRRTRHLRFVVIHAEGTADGAEAMAGALGGILGGPTQVHVLRVSSADALEGAILALLPDAAARVVLLAMGDAGPLVIETLRLGPILRDRTVALVLDGCPLGGVPTDPPRDLSVDERAAWAAAHLSQEAFDTELKRSVPWLLVQRLVPSAEPAGDGRIPWIHQRVPEPPVPSSGRRPVAMVDLGPVPAGDAAPHPTILARALILVLVALQG